jgi:NAD(P)-dependent dehydrogenase (short-subunit alcohol dehydrogenase family)
MREIVGQALSRFGKIDGVIHAAGVAGGGMTQVKTRDAAAAVLAPKVEGTMNLAAALDGLPLDFFALCSSITAIRGALGQVDYCAANCCLDAFARSHRVANSVSINWDAWQEVGMAVETSVPGDLAERRQRELRAVGVLPAEGVDAFERILRTRLSQVIVSPQSRMLSSLKSAAAQSTAEPGRTSEAEAVLHPRPTLHSSYVAPRDEVEAMIALIWGKVLGVEQIGIHDNFFELGGHSLLATQVVSRVRESLKVELPLRAIFECTTVAGLSDRIRAARESASEKGRETAILDELEQLSEEEAQRLLTIEVEKQSSHL